MKLTRNADVTYIRENICIEIRKQKYIYIYTLVANAFITFIKKRVLIKTLLLSVTVRKNYCIAVAQ